MHVHFYATLRQLTGRKTIDLDLAPGATVQALLDAVIKTYPPMRAELLDDRGELFRHVHLFINGRDAPFLDRGLQTVLKKTDKVDLFPAVAGG